MVADAFPLFKEATGTVLVARLDRTFKAGVRRLAWTIRHVGGSLLGTVATAAEARDPSGRYDYAYGLPHAAEPTTADGFPVWDNTARRSRLGRILRRNGRAPSAEAEPSNVGSRN